MDGDNGERGDVIDRDSRYRGMLLLIAEDSIRGPTSYMATLLGTYITRTNLYQN